LNERTDGFWSYEEFINKIKTDDEFAKKWGELGPVYGKQWRRWGIEWEDTESIKYIDQIQNLINDLKTNPDSRRLMVNAWNVGELDQMVLPPCHYGFQVYTRELSLEERCNLANFAPFDDRFPDGDGFKWDEYTINIAEDWLKQHHLNLPKRAISLMWNQRSVDTFLGLPFNIASYGLLLEIIAKSVNMVPDELIGNLGDVHLYSNHIEQAKEQLTRKRYKLPTLRHLKTDEFYKSLGDDLSLITHLDNTDFVIENYQSHPAIKAPLSN
jgi:thymidylate synthase